MATNGARHCVVALTGCLQTFQPLAAISADLTCRPRVQASDSSMEQHADTANKPTAVQPAKETRARLLAAVASLFIIALGLGLGLGLAAARASNSNSTPSLVVPGEVTLGGLTASDFTATSAQTAFTATVAAHVSVQAADVHVVSVAATTRRRILAAAGILVHFTVAVPSAASISSLTTAISALPNDATFWTDLNSGLLAAGAPPATAPDGGTHVQVTASQIAIASIGTQRRRSLLASSTPTLAATTVNITGSSLVGGMNLQSALDSTLAVNLSAVFVKGTTWKVSNYGRVDPGWANTDVIKFTDSMSFTSQNANVAAFGLCMPPVTNGPAALTQSIAIVSVGTRMLVSTASLWASCSGGSCTFPGSSSTPFGCSGASKPPVLPGDMDFCVVQSVATVVSATATAVTILQSSPDCGFTGGSISGNGVCACGKLSLFELMP